MWEVVGTHALKLSFVWVGSMSCYNYFRPLNVVWDLDETLVSSEEIPVDNPKPCKEHVLHLVRGEQVEHIDDDGLHFVTRVRPYAFLVLHFLRYLPGCRLFVSTAASPGYMWNVLALLDPRGKLFSNATANQRGKDIYNVIPKGNDARLRRTVLIDNNASYHRPQPQNGIVVTDFVYPSCQLVLQGADGRTVGRFPADTSMPLDSWLTLVGSQGEAKGKLAIAQLSKPLAKVADEAHLRGATALVVYHPQRSVSCFRVRHANLALPLVGVGSAAGKAFNSLVGSDARACVEKCPDCELLWVGFRLFLCWMLPNVRWALGGGNASQSRK